MINIIAYYMIKHIINLLHCPRDGRTPPARGRRHAGGGGSSLLDGFLPGPPGKHPFQNCVAKSGQALHS